MAKPMTPAHVKSPATAKVPELKSSSSTLHAHGDNTYHVTSGEYGMNGPERTEHEDIGAALMHMHKMHGKGPAMHIQAHEDGYTAHSMDDDGKMDSREHSTMRSLKQHVSDAMGVE